MWWESPSYKGHCYPPEVIAHCVWLYFRFPLSFREFEELMLQRGVIVSYETIRRWCLKVGQHTPTACAAAHPRLGTFTTGVIPRRPQARPVGGLRVNPGSSSK